MVPTVYLAWAQMRIAPAMVRVQAITRHIILVCAHLETTLYIKAGHPSSHTRFVEDDRREICFDELAFISNLSNLGRGMEARQLWKNESTGHSLAWAAAASGDDPPQAHGMRDCYLMSALTDGRSSVRSAGCISLDRFARSHARGSLLVRLGERI